MNPFLHLSQLGKSYGPAVIVEDFELTVKPGEFIALIGHSGCGKSTVLSMVAGLTDISAGRITLSGRPIMGAGPDRGVVFQAPCLLPWLTARENVQLGVDQVLRGQASTRERRAVAEYYLMVVGLGDAMEKRPADLSQGMRQRCGIARAFALAPQILLLDEPFGMLDSLTRCELQEALLDLWQETGKTAIMVTHDVDEALYLADRVVMMTNGPAATIGDILEISFPRPRVRRQLLEDPEYYRCREHLITFLEERSHLRPLQDPDDAPPPAPAEPGAFARLQNGFTRWRERRAIAARA